MPEDRDIVRRHIVVHAPVQEAFRRFVHDLAAWWPRAFTFSGAALDTVAAEPREGGRWFERADDGSELEWGEVRTWDPPHRVVVSWRVGADREQEPPERASEVEVRFTEREPSRTLVEVQHREFERHGDGADAMRRGMASDQGWQGLLEAFAEPYETGGEPSDEAIG